MAPPADEVCEVVITGPDPDWLVGFTRRLVIDRLGASGHNVAPIRTSYRWHGQVHDTTEGRVALPTRRSLLPQILDHRRHLTDDPEVRCTEGGIARARFRVAASGQRERKPSFFTVIVWRDQAEHAAESLSRGSRVVVSVGCSSGHGPLRMGSARQVVEVVADELGPSLRWATATTRSTRSKDRQPARPARRRSQGG